MPYLGAMKFQMSRFSQVGAIVLGAGVLHLAMLACNGGDSETAAHAGTGGGATTGSASGTGGSAATSGSSTASGPSTGSGCGCSTAQPEVIEVACKDTPSMAPIPSKWLATLDMPGRTQESLIGTIAFASPTDKYTPLNDGKLIDYASAQVIVRGTSLIVSCQLGMEVPSIYKSVKFVVPAAN